METESVNVFALVAVLGLLLGLSLVILSVVIQVKQYIFRGRARRARGEVVEIVEASSGPGRRLKYPVVEFETERGRTVEFESSVGSNPSLYRVGQRVSVLYDPDEPQKATIDSFLSRWLATLITGCLGVSFLFVGMVFLLIVVAVRASR
jgi:hypothetical protein